MLDTSKRTYTVGVDMGATKMLAALVDDQGHILARKKRATASEQGASATVGRMAEAILGAVEKAGLSVESVDAVGIGAPGPLDPEAGVVMSAPNLKWEPNVPLKRMVEQEVGRPTFLDNDVNLGTLGEATWGAGQGLGSIIGIFVGTGIGGGLIIDGELYEGYNRTAGEVGHLVLQVDGPLCGCGSRGCMEALASRSAMERDIRQAVTDGEPTLMSKLVDLNADTPIKSSALAEAYQAEDEVVVCVVDRACRYLGIGVASLIDLLSPQMVILGGGVIEALGDRMMPLIEQTAHEYAFRQAIKDVQIVPAKLGDDAGVLGAAELARRRIGPVHEARSNPRSSRESLPTDRGGLIGDAGFGYIVIGQRRYERDVVIWPDGTVKKRKKKLSKKEHGTAHRLSAVELEVVLKGQRPDLLLVGTGYNGGLSLATDAVKWLKQQAIPHQALPTPEAIGAFKEASGKAIALLHVTC